MLGDACKCLYSYSKKLISSDPFGKEIERKNILRPLHGGLKLVKYSRHMNGKMNIFMAVVYKRLPRVPIYNTDCESWDC